MTQPILYVFAISHYCEKARWALDYLGVDYALRHLAPGNHMQVANELGAPGSSLPLLVAGCEVVQGSGAIIAWAESAVTDASNRLSPESESDSEACRALEQRLDDIAGVHLRRLYYSEAIIEHPGTVLPMFARDLPAGERSALEESWGVVCKLMIGMMNLGFEQGKESQRLVEGELDWLDDRLSDGRRFMLGDRFSRADITAAGLLAPLALPPEHPTYGDLEVPPRMQTLRERWAGRPITGWVSEIYREYR